MTSLKQHYKERNPMDTVQLITDFFTNRGYKIKITSIEQSEIGTWTCHVEIFKGNLKVQHAHGKGVTKEYCLASGHAELYERFCNKAVNGLGLTFMKKFVEESNIKNGYSFSPNEKILTYKQVMETPVIANFCTKFFANNESQIMAFFDTVTDDVYTGVDYVNLLDPDNIQYYDPRILFRVLNTVGLAAGNTLQEALNQAISEIFEDEMSEYFFTHENVSYVEINPKSLSADKQLFIQKIEEAGFKVKILDLSYTFNTPVVASLLINPYQLNCQFNFGSFPIFDIAVERVLTELYQGTYSFLNKNASMQIPSKEDCNMFNYGNNITELTRVPQNFFENLIVKDSYNTEVFLSENNSNETILEYYKTLAKKREFNIYYKDNSLCNEICAVSVVIPEILFKDNMAERYGKISPLIKRDMIVSAMRHRKQIEDLQNFNAENIDTIYERMYIIRDEISQWGDGEMGSVMGRIMGEDAFTPTAQLDTSFSVAFAILELNYYTEDRISQLANSIFYESVKEIMTVQRYANSGLYTSEEIVQMFALYGKTLDEDFIDNCTNDKYLFLYGFVKPYYEYYHSDTYKEIIHSFMK